jgi:hypothetical protein
LKIGQVEKRPHSAAFSPYLATGVKKAHNM